MMHDEQATLVLFSGGMDSTISLYYALDRARKQGGRVHTLSFYYGQRHNAELISARVILDMVRADDQYAGHFGHHNEMRISIPANDSTLLTSTPVDKYADVQEAEMKGDSDKAFVPYRNLLMLTLGAMYAYGLGAKTMTTGLRGGYSDCTSEFERRAQSLLLMATGYPLRIETPTHMSRADCLMLAQQLPGCMRALAMTLTCFEGTTPPCGHCLPCLKRAAGFQEIGLPDPLLERLGLDGLAPSE